MQTKETKERYRTEFEETEESYLPSSYFKDKSPLPDDFLLNDERIKIIEAELLEIENDEKTKYINRSKLIDRIQNTSFEISMMIVTISFLTLFPVSLLHFFLKKLIFFKLTELLIIIIAFGLLLNVIVFFPCTICKSYLEKSHSLFKKDNDIKYANYNRYLKAISNHEWWKKKIKFDYWKDLSQREYVNAIVCSFREKGWNVEVNPKNEENTEFIVKINNLRILVQCTNSNEGASLFFAQNLLWSIEKNGKCRGLLISLYGVSNETLYFCRQNQIMIWSFEDMVRNFSYQV